LGCHAWKRGKKRWLDGCSYFFKGERVTKKKALKGWLGADSIEGRTWVGEQNMRSKYKEKFLGGTKKLF
jgi:hypothetical protein